MKYIEFNKTVCGVNLLLNVIDFQSDCPFALDYRTTSADFFQIYFLKKANGYLLLNDKKIELESNSVIFISKHQHYSWYVDYAQFEGQLLLFQDEFLNDFFSDQFFIFRFLYFYQTKFPLSLKISDVILSENLMKLAKIKEELIHSKTDSVHLIRSLLYYILISLNRLYAVENNLKNAISVDNTAYHFRQLVEKHINKLHRVEDYTALLGISRISLNKVVKEQFNVTVTSFIKLRLLFEIKMKLIHTTMTISEIADRYNFSEPNHLSRFFKQKTNYSPTDFRLAYQNGIDL
ncbi:helix-turn-helix domain-containing protein [Aureispira anguillae]|uniref:AraC family transcriptional regulator n=1 Tax=Aureispira anguillae TaxID=2864201 RepID=A0A915YEA5_9BACT|nr:AraC family transcriptional regulator [Aureispira anguillae]BDS11460.1 AraC family transcriptional regulator [Aureispira anguillae]